MLNKLYKLLFNIINMDVLRVCQICKNNLAVQSCKFCGKSVCLNCSKKGICEDCLKRF